MSHPPSAHRPQTLQSDEQKPRDQARIQIEAPHRTINTQSPASNNKHLLTRRGASRRCSNKRGQKKRRNERVHEMGKESQASEREPKESDREPRQEQA